MPEPANKSSVDAIIAYPLARKIANCGIAPIHITLINAILSIFIVFLLYSGYENTVVLGCLFVLRFFLDIVDGATARKCDTVTPEGAFLDYVFDVIFAPATFIAIGYRRSWSPLATIGSIASYCLLTSRIQSTKNFTHDNSLLLKPLLYTILAG
jgi:phosphatidylglycerophosphate synthase